MPAFEIRYLTPVERDLEGIFDYVLKDNPSAAAGLLDKFDHSILTCPINKPHRPKCTGWSLVSNNHHRRQHNQIKNQRQNNHHHRQDAEIDDRFETGEDENEKPEA